MKSLIVALMVVVVAVIGYQLFVFTVDETEKAVVLQFGNIERVVEQPGLYFKKPVIQNVVFLNDRLLNLDIKPAQVITIDKQRLTVDSYTLWRISDARRFVETMRGLRANAEKRIDDIVYSLLRDVLGRKSFEDILKREFLTDVKELASAQLIDFGITVIDVRLKRADLPGANEQAVYQRMMSERKQIAQRYRAEGEQQSQRLRAEADRKIQIIIAEAHKKAEQLKGEGDAEALEIYANAYNRDPAFFRFWRTLESYKLSLAHNTTLVLSSDSEYLKLLEVMGTKKAQ
ncbi:protease modulator HflC [bacterium]|nr:protease modulator HflC [bacterium]